MSAPVMHPRTTTDRRGAGGPMNHWDSSIASALRNGDAAMADSLRTARARVNNAFGPEAVFVPTQAQAAMLGLIARATRDGLATLPAEGLVESNHDGVPERLNGRNAFVGCGPENDSLAGSNPAPIADQWVEVEQLEPRGAWRRVAA